MKIKTKYLSQTSVFLLLLCLQCFVTYSQPKETFVKKIYAQGGGGPTSHSGGAAELGAQSVFKNNWVATFSYHNISMEPKNLPADYEPGVFLLLPFDQTSEVEMNLFSFTGGRFFETGRKSWITAEAGVSIVSGETMTFTPTPSQFYILGTTSNYTEKTEKKSAIGGMLKADFNWALWPYVGLGVGAFANFNSIQSPVGFQVKLICGWMNRKSKH